MKIHRRLNPNQGGSEADKLLFDLRNRIVGQDEAVNEIVQVYQAFLAGMTSPGRPIANILFLGPTGSGKTRLVEALAESVTGDARAVIKIDCAEFQHSHEVAKLIGSPPGYLGHRETHALLSQESLNQYHTENIKLSFVLFDEIEKASDALWNLLLGILDKATLTLGDNRRVDFSRAMIFMTGNLGAGEMAAILRPNLGFASAAAARDGETPSDEHMVGKITRAGMEAARRNFTPEFMNRIDRTIVFRPLGENELRRILTMELNQVQRRIFESSTAPSFVLEFTDPVREYLLKEGTDLKSGARHLKRAIERHLVHPLSNLIATGQIRVGDLIKVDCSPSGPLSFYKETEDVPAYAMMQMVDFTGQPAYKQPNANAAVAGTDQTRTATPKKRIEK